MVEQDTLRFVIRVQLTFGQKGSKGENNVDIIRNKV